MARFFGTVFFASVLFFVTLATGCSRFKPMERAERLEQHGHPEQALEIYKSQLARTPEYDRVQQADLQFHMGECLLALDRTREAFSAFNRAVELDDSHPTAHLRLGEMYLMSGSLDHASEQAQKILERNNGNLDALALLGAAASAGGNDGVARNAFEDVLEKDPTRVKVALSLADLLTSRGETKTARIVLQRTAQAQPKSPLPWLTLGRLEETLGRIDEAEKDYRHAVVVEDSPETNLRLAQFLERTARIDEAKQILLHVDALRPAFRTARGDLELISGHATQAQERYLQSLNGFTSDSHSNDPESRARTVSRLVEADLAAGGPKAVKLARVHLDYFRDSVDQATREILLTEIALADSDFSTAKVHAAAAVQLAPDSAAAQYIDGVTKLRLGDLSAARSAFESSLDNDSDYIPSHIEMSKLLLDQGDIQGAEQMIVPTVREEPANVAALVAFGHVLISEHDLDSARVIAARIHSAAPDSIAADLMEGEIALADQDGGRALLSFQKAVLEDPRSHEAVEGIARAYQTGKVNRFMLLSMEKIALAKPASSTLLEITGRIFAEHGWPDDAKRCLAASLRLDPSRSSAALQLTRLLVRSGDEHQAAQYAMLIPGIANLVMAVNADQRGDRSAAVAAYETAVRAGDPTSVAANNLAWIYAEQGTNPTRALELAQRAVELAPDDAGVLDTLGFVRLQRHEYSDAVGILEHARTVARATNASELSDIEKHLHTAYLNAGQTERAAALRASLQR